MLRLLNELHDFNHELTRKFKKRTGINSANYFTDALANVRRVTKHGSVLFIISDFVNCDESSKVHLQALARNNDVVGIHISDPLEKELPAQGVYSITDGRSRSRIDTANQRQREAYKNNFHEKLARVSEEFLRCRSPLLMLQTDRSIVGGLNSLASKVSAPRNVR